LNKTSIFVNDMPSNKQLPISHKSLIQFQLFKMMSFTTSFQNISAIGFKRAIAYTLYWYQFSSYKQVLKSKSLTIITLAKINNKHWEFRYLSAKQKTSSYNINNIVCIMYKDHALLPVSLSISQVTSLVKVFIWMWNLGLSLSSPVIAENTYFLLRNGKLRVKEKKTCHIKTL
jgi:hypothetical protein